MFPLTLVLGSSGRLGRALQRIWIDRPVIWASRQRKPGLVCLDPLREEGRLAEAAMGHRAILSLAGVTECRGDLALNSELALAAIRAAASARVSTVLLCSSAAVYGLGDGMWRETSPTHPISAYGLAKLRMERAAIALARALSVRLCVLRIGNVAGADAILGGWVPGFALDQMPDGQTPLRSYIGPNDLAHVLATLLSRQDTLPEVLNIAQPEPVRMGALLRAADLTWSPRRPCETIIPKVTLDTSRLNRILALPSRENPAQAIVQDWKNHVRAWA